MSEFNPIQSASASASVSNENVKRILSLLRSGDEKLDFAESNDAILILGNTGSGKSTFAQFIAGNNNDLFAIEVGENTGEFIIADTNNKISLNSTIISKTLIPEKIIGRETKMVVFDCPGFGDVGRNEAYDIAAAFFIKKVLKNVKNVKIVLTVSYPSLRKGVNRSDFLQLLGHTIVLIKHIEKYVDAVALIATKVDNTVNLRNNVPVLVSDGIVIQNIAQFLLEVKGSIQSMKNLDQVFQSESKLVEFELFSKASDKLLTALLQKRGAEYPRLGIFRRPVAPGALSKSDFLQNGKKTIINMLNNELKYVSIDEADIGYAVSDKSKNVIGDLVTEIDKTIASDMVGLNDVLTSYCKKLEVEMLKDDMYSLIEHLQDASKALAEISSIHESARADELALITRKNLPQSCEPAAAPFLDDITSLSRFYNFLQDVSDKQFESMAIKWIKSLQGSIKYAGESVRWYEFLAALHQRMSQYDVQKDSKRFHVPKFESVSGPLGGYQNFINFFNQISDVNLLKVVNLQGLLEINVDNVKIRYFNRVISTAFGAGPHFSTDLQSGYANFDGLRFLVTGEYVKLSELLNRPEYESCESLQILAKHSVFVDADLKKNIDLSIIAPRWVIIGSNTIDLSGSPGLPHVPSKAPDGNREGAGKNGHNGRPGLPGESAGHFFGIGEIFENIENLNITAVGGAGGDGQDGGDGAPGSDGNSHSIGYQQYQLYCALDEECYTEINYSKSGIFNLNVKGDITFIKYGSPGKRGGDAGYGGGPGIGGHAGSVTLLGTGLVKPSVVTNVGPGPPGDFGLHGECGPGGSGGATHKAWYYFGTWSKTENHVESSLGHADNGPMGTCLYSSSASNSNYDGRLHPVPKEFLFPPSLAITDFRKELMNNFNDTVKKHHALKFYQMLQKKEYFQYDKAELIFQELVALEKIRNQFTPEVIRLLYALLLERIREYYKTIQNVPTSKDHKLLEFLTLAINSQLLRLESKSESRQILNLEAYFDVLKTTDVAQIRQFFMARAEDEIKSAEHVIGIISGDISDTIERSTNEIIKLARLDTYNELGDQLLKFKLFTNLRTIGDFLTLCVSLAEAYLAAVNTLQVTSVLPKLQSEISPVSGSRISKSLSTIEETFEKYIDAIRSNVLKEKMVLKSLDMVEYDGICDQLQDADMILQSRKSLTGEAYIYPAYFSISDVVQGVLDINKNLSNVANAVAQNATRKFQQNMKVIEISPQLYYALLTQEIDPSSIIFHPQNSQENITSFKGVEGRADFIDKTVGEMFEAMFTLFRATRGSLIDYLYQPRNLKELIVMVSQALSRVNLTFFDLIKGFDIDEDLQLTIENMEEAFDEVTSLFDDVLLSHHDRASFSSFHSYLEKQTDLGNSVQQYLLGVVDANALFYEYERSLDVYHIYISPLDVSSADTPPVPSIDEAKLSLHRSSIADSFQILKSKLDSSNENRSIYILSDDFNSSNQNGAFYTWESQNYEQSISKLLRGKEIALKASNVNKKFAFLKFDDIRLSFKSNDLSVQRSLDKDLSNFNISMKHSGKSYFNLCDRVQLINQDAVSFMYKANETFAEIDDRNAGLTKPPLSPFTTWIFKLKPIDKSVSFDSLLPYRKTELSIALEGNAIYVDLQNKTFCQIVLRNGPEMDAGFVDFTEIAVFTSAPQLSPVVRKRRNVNSFEGTSRTSFNNSFNPFFNRIDDQPDPRFDHSPNSELEGSNYEPKQPSNFWPSLNINAALTFVDFFVRNFTKVKPYQSTNKSISPEEARVIALNILDRFENMLKNMTHDEPALITDWERNNPIELLCQLEKYASRQEYAKIIDLLSQSVSLNPSLEEEVRHELAQDVKQSFTGSTLRVGIEIDNHYSRFTNGLLCNQSDDANNMLNGNIDYSLLN